MFFDPEKVPGVGQLILIDIEQNENVRREFDKLFEDVEGLSRTFCAVFAELSDAYRTWAIYGLPYTSKTIHLAGIGRKKRIDLLALWSEVLILKAVRLTDKSKIHEPVSIVQFLKLDLEPGLKKEVKDLIEITKNKSKVLRRARNKFISHKEMDVVEGKVNIYEPGFTIHDIADVLESIVNILKCIYIHYSGKDDTSFSGYLTVWDEIEY